MTGELEVFVAKSLYLTKAATHDDGWAGYEADALREVAALRRVAGVPGVVEYRNMITEPDGAIHIILE